jgi:hypothetical protein
MHMPRCVYLQCCVQAALQYGYICDVRGAASQRVDRVAHGLLVASARGHGQHGVARGVNQVFPGVDVLNTAVHVVDEPLQDSDIAGGSS